MRILISLGLALALAACGGSGEKRKSADDRAAEGEVLGGMISDDMLPLESVESQSPTLKVAPAATTTDAEGAEGEAVEGDAADSAPAPAEPGEEPAE